MDFKEATDALFARLDHAELAEALGISVASIRQARLSPEANASRAPPVGWKDAVINLAQKQVNQYLELIERLQKMDNQK